MHALSLTPRFSGVSQHFGSVNCFSSFSRVAETAKAVQDLRPCTIAALKHGVNEMETALSCSRLPRFAS